MNGRARRMGAVYLALSAALVAGAVGPALGVGIPSQGFTIKLHHVLPLAAHTVAGSLWLRRLGRPVLWAPVLTFGFGALIEWIQVFLPHRFGDWRDLVQNGLGVLLGLAGMKAAGVFRRRAPVRRKER